MKKIWVLSAFLGPFEYIFYLLQKKSGNRYFNAIFALFGSFQWVKFYSKVSTYVGTYIDYYTICKEKYLDKNPFALKLDFFREINTIIEKS